MAKNQPRPGRTLAIFLILTGVLCGVAALGGTWTPRLGLDLQGGTRIQMTSEPRNPGNDKLQEAAAIIDSRVNGTGVAESLVSTQGDSNIVVEIPGQNRKDLLDQVTRTAQLRFRLVANCGQGPCVLPGRPSDQESQSPSPSPSGSPSGSTSGSPSESATAEPKGKASSTPTDNRVPPAWAESPSPSTGPSPSGDASPGGQQTAEPSGGASGATPAAPGAPKGVVAQALAFQSQPPQEWIGKLVQHTCPEAGQDAEPVADDPDKPLVTCDQDGNKVLLSRALIEGTDLSSASFGPPSQGVGWAVQLSFKAKARSVFGDVTTALQRNGQLFAIVLDSTVLSSPGVNQPILDGNAEITGDFKEAEARDLANSLKYGALPLRFPEGGISVEDIGATLAGNQLQGGLIAGAVGLLLVMVYSMLYYRGLGLVVLASLVLAAVITYAGILFLSEAAGFTLTLPGIAGLILGVGITADSFIVYFERIRDEMREGRSMRVAVETGWRQARNTCLAADAVSMLAAVVLYVFAIGVVKGFAFALGLSTIIDIVVFFWFTKPMMTLLARKRFFNSGHKWSGLSPETLGVDGPRLPLTHGGKA